MSDDYTPFPHAELEAIAVYHESVADNYRHGSFLRVMQLERAAICRNAIASYVALNERCLRAELARDHGVSEQSVDAIEAAG